jgi:hypothetical protein
VSTIALFSYVQLLFAGLLSFAVFGTVLGAMTLVGGLIIAASGLYTAHRERVRAREAWLVAAGDRTLVSRRRLDQAVDRHADAELIRALIALLSRPWIGRRSHA